MGTLLLCSPICASTALGSGDSLDVLDKELRLIVDNDALFFGTADKYYSSGIFANYRRLLKPGTLGHRIGSKSTLKKAIVSYGIFHQMYTASNIKYSNENQIDRPYAGWLGMNLGLEYYYSRQSVLKLKTDLGWLGPATRTDEIQIWLHDWLGMKKPRGWEFQINNTLAAHIGASYLKRIAGTRGVDVISVSSARLGTIQNNVRTGLGFRFGQLMPLFNSVYTNSKMGQEQIRVQDIPAKKRIQEIYFFVNLTMEYVVYNATIEGNIIGEKSAFTKKAKSAVFHQEYGVARSGRYLDLSMSLVLRSTEVFGGDRHKYFSIKISHRI